MALILSFPSCKKFVEVDPPINQIGSDVVFTTDQTALSTVAGLYSRMMNSTPDFFDGYMSLYTGLAGDELSRTSPNVAQDEFYNNAISVANTSNSTMWTRAYQYIYQANQCIEGLTAASTLTDTLRNQLLGEAKFLRAFTFFYLANIFGDIPLTNTTNFEINAVMPRKSMDEVYNQIVTDLIDAENLLYPSYPGAERIRINKWTAAAMLSRVYLYKKDYPGAEAEASKVINSGMYSLVTPLNKVFVANSNEAIWQLRPFESLTRCTSEGLIYTPTSGTVKPTYIISTSLINAFEVGDLRKTNWLKTQTVATIPYTFPYKYTVRAKTAGSTATEYIVMLRLSEMYLIRSEARNEQNNITGAIADLNVIRKRAGLTDLTISSQPIARDAIQKERRVELFVEWGHRWMDMKRTGKIDAIMGAFKPTKWKTTAALFPIPLGQLRLNVNLIQNEGYN